MRKLFGVVKPRSLRAISALADLLRLAMNLVERTLFAAEHLKRQKSMKLKLNQQFMPVG